MARISANQLAQYMVSSETGKLGIIAAAKQQNTAMVIRYKDAREAVKAFLTDDTRDVSVIHAAIAHFEQAKDDPSLSNFGRSDAASSKEALEAFDSMKNQLGGFEFFAAPKKQPKLNLQGVDVSVNLDLHIRRDYKGEAQIGGAIFRFSQAGDESAAAATKRREMGAYVATLVHMHVASNLSTNRTPAHPICFSVDVQFREAIAAPRTYARRARDMENACRFISAIWESV